MSKINKPTEPKAVKLDQVSILEAKVAELQDTVEAQGLTIAELEGKLGTPSSLSLSPKPVAAAKTFSIKGKVFELKIKKSYRLNEDNTTTLIDLSEATEAALAEAYKDSPHLFHPLN